MVTSKKPCGYCGWQEIDHEAVRTGVFIGYIDPSKPRKGYLFTVSECVKRGGYMKPSLEGKKLQQTT